MNSQLYTDLNPELISKLESYIDTNNPSDNVSALSNFQIPISIINLETIKNSNQPSYIYAGDFSSGYYHCNYYKHSNGNIYVMNFYMQKFEHYYLLEEWEKQLKSPAQVAESKANKLRELQEADDARKAKEAAMN
jgi:hypothetical protein